MIQCTETDLNINLGVHQQKENVVYTHSGVSFSTEKNELGLFTGKWVELELILATIRKMQKDKYYVLSCVEPRLYTHVCMCMTWK